MPQFGELRMEANLENVRIVSHFLEGIAQRLHLTEKAMFDVQLAVEEAAVNIVNHAYPDDETGEMSIRVDVTDDFMRIMLTDWGLPLNPDNVRPFDVNAPIETRIKGGMGLHFINTLMDDVTRTRDQTNGNTLTLTKRIERLEAGAQPPSALRELNAMLSVSQVMATNIKLDDLLGRIINELMNAIEAERGTLYLVDKGTDELVSRVLSQDTGDVTEIRVKIGEGIAGQVAASGTVRNIRRAYEDPDFSPAFDKVTGFRSGSILAAPMRNQDQQIIGVVQLLNKRGGHFTSRDERLLTAMASQAAISIENARLYAQEMRQRLIDQELETAKKIQMSFLPQHKPEHPKWDIATFWLPMRDVGGDFYDFYKLPDDRWAVIIADVSGKGVPAAMFMAFGVTVLRFAMRLGFSPAQLISHANQSIIDSQQSKMFATVFAAYLDLDHGLVEFASGGHNPPLFYRAGSETCDYLECDGVALGLFPGAAYDQKTLAMQAGDVLVMYTDGITEAINDAEDEFSEERLESIICDNATLAAQDLADLIVQAVKAFSADPDGFDDETLVVIKYR